MWPTALLGSLFLILLGWLWWARQEGLRDASRQLEALINEARLISLDMEVMLNNAVNFSKNVADDWEQRIQQCQSQAVETGPSQSDPLLQFYQELAGGDIKRTALPSQDQAREAAPASQPLQLLSTNLDVPAPLADPQLYREMHPTLAVNQLNHQGLDVKQIAQILQRGQGEVELILNLTRKKKLDKAT
jgi:hypothetical protein